MHNRNRVTNAQIAEALENSAGIMSAAAQQLGVQRAAVSRRVAKSPRLTRLLAEVKARMLDLAESKLLQGLKNGDKTYVIFYLKTQGRERGYIERPREEPNTQATADIAREIVAAVREMEAATCGAD